MGRGFEAGGRPDRPHVAGIACVRMANGSFGCTAFAADVLARGIAGRVCAAAMDTRGGLVPRAPEQAVSWAASHGGMDGLTHRSGHGTWRIGLVYATGVGECGMPPPGRHGRRRRVLVIVATPDLPQGGSGDEKPSS